LIYGKKKKNQNKKREQQMKNIKDYLVTILFLSVGTLFLIIGIFMSSGIFLIDEQDRVYTNAIITHIDTNHDSDGDTDHDVYIKYSANGKEYESQLNLYSSSYYEGKEIEVYYDKNDPSNVETDEVNNMLSIIFIAIGGSFALISGIVLFIQLRNSSISKSLLKNGIRIDAEYVETILNTIYQVNGRSPYKIICKWKNPNTGIEHKFKSSNIWDDPQYAIENNNITKIPVYIDQKNPEKYYVDIQEIQRKINI